MTLGAVALPCEKLSCASAVSKSSSLAATNGEALDSGLLLSEAEGGAISLLDILGNLNTVELNMAVAGEVRADATVGTVRATAAGNSALNNDVVDDAVVNVELLGLGVGAEVDKELTHAVHGLLGPATLSVLEGLDLGMAADATGVLSEGNNLFVLQNSLHVLDGLVELPALNGASDLVSVFVVGAEVTNSALSGYCQKREKVRQDDSAKGRKWAPQTEIERKEMISLTTYTWQAQRAV